MHLMQDKQIIIRMLPGIWGLLISEMCIRDRYPGDVQLQLPQGLGRHVIGQRDARGTEARRKIHQTVRGAVKVIVDFNVDVYKRQIAY